MIVLLQITEGNISANGGGDGNAPHGTEGSLPAGGDGRNKDAPDGKKTYPLVVEGMVLIQVEQRNHTIE